MPITPHHKTTQNNGALPLLIVMTMGIFLVMMVAGATLIQRLAHYTTDQEAEEHAFAAADAGVNYTAWLLNSGTKTPAQLNGSPAPTKDVINEEPEPDEIIGTFDVSFAASVVNGADRVTVTAIGKDYNRQDVCQTIEAAIQEIQPGAGAGSFALIKWDHKVNVSCS